MSAEHLITPPIKLVQKWVNEENGIFVEHIATQAARWGWDQRNATVAAELQQARDGELQACCAWLHKNWWPDSSKNYVIEHLRYDRRAAIRPKPPSLKEQALAALDRQELGREGGLMTDKAMVDAEIIRAALEALPND